MSTNIYAGIGSRQTPAVVLQAMSYIGGALSLIGFTVRSGGADGADTAFTSFVTKPELLEVYIPWKNFNNVKNGIVTGNIEDAEMIVQDVHPAWQRCSSGARKLHTRNVFQVLGPEPISNPIPVDFVCCYTKDGIVTGGTATAINIAKQHNIPIFNFGDYEHIIGLHNPDKDNIDSSTVIDLIVVFSTWLSINKGVEL